MRRCSAIVVIPDFRDRCYLRLFVMVIDNCRALRCPTIHGFYVAREWEVKGDGVRCRHGDPERRAFARGVRWVPFRTQGGFQEGGPFSPAGTRICDSRLMSANGGA